MTGKVTADNIMRWDSLFAGRAWGQYPPEELVRFLARTFPDKAARRGMRALEVGCGGGANLWLLAREGFQIAGIDGSSHAVRMTKEKLRSEGLAMPSDDLKVGNFASLPWQDQSFDAVVDIEAISANVMSTIQATIAEGFRVLKPGGWFFSKMFGPKTWGLDSGNFLEPGTIDNPTSGPLKDIGLIHAFTKEEIQTLLSGFINVSINWVHRGDRNGKHEIFEWIVQAQK
jgi:ubiquinone/menaquinone biosynthesis C-methylase UbiE